MKVYQTNAALDYAQFAFLIRLDKSKNGYNYFCVGTQFNDYYRVGKIVEDLEDCYIEDSDFKIDIDPLCIYLMTLFAKYCILTGVRYDKGEDNPEDKGFYRETSPDSELTGQQLIQEFLNSTNEN